LSIIKGLATFAALVALVMPYIVTAQPAPAFPKAILGIWMDDDDEGKSRCRSYLEALRIEGVDASAYLVGAQIISATRWLSYEEYGEGDTYNIISLTKVGGRKWRFRAIFHAGEPAVGADMISTVSLNRGKLLWDLESLGGYVVDSWDEHRYFRCSAVPHYFFAN
jgi:hypothetical protein